LVKREAPDLIIIIITAMCVHDSVFWGSYEIHQPHKIEETFRALTDMYAKGHLKPITCAVYPLVRHRPPVSLTLPRSASCRTVC
jgi:hypothetical protein